MSLAVELDPDSPADDAGFRGLTLVVDAVASLPDAAWRVVGGWMVRAWVQGSDAGVQRPTIDVDLAILASRGEGWAAKVPERLEAAGLRPTEEPFRLRGPNGILVDLLVPPGASRREPPQLGKQIVFEARGSRFSFELPPEHVSVSMGSDRVGFPTPRLAAALVLKAVVLGIARPGRAHVDAIDVAQLLAVVRREPAEVVEDLRAHARRSDVRDAQRHLEKLFSGEGDPGAILVARETDARTALSAVAVARWLLEQL
jgi:hypothetical protein